MIIDVYNLGFTYPNGKEVFQNLNFTVKQGSIVSVLGPNGCGKSTLLSCLARLNRPNTGDVLIDGRSYQHMTQQEIAAAIGFVPQNIDPSFNFTVIDYVVTGCAPRMGAFQKPRAPEYEMAWNAIQAMKIEHLADKSFLRISGGERQQVVIARVIAQKPAFILLDEPTSHLDAGNQIKVLELLRRMADEGYGVIMTTHNPDQVLLLDGQVAALDRNGHLTFGRPEDIITEELLFNLYGTKFQLLDMDRKVCVLKGIGS